MRNRDRFFEAFAHTEHRVMGRVLQPFTLRHRFWLEVFESPLVTGGEASMVDVLQATLVCAMPFEHLNRKLPRILARGPSWRDKIRYGWRVLFHRLPREYRAFQAYLLDHGCPPAIHGGGETIGEGGDEIPEDTKLPGLLGLVTGLMRCGWGDAERIWALSPGAAEWYLTGGFLHRGVDVPVKSEADEVFEAHFEKLRAEKEREALAQGSVGAEKAAAEGAHGIDGAGTVPVAGDFQHVESVGHGQLDGTGKVIEDVLGGPLGPDKE